MLLIKFAEEFFHILIHVFHMSENELVLAILMPNSFALPPLDSCRGVSPSEDAACPEAADA